ncbi:MULTISPECIES: hypothetical protein [Streptomyces]|uniref:Integral membrane protein n=1 Tax=Streptomyces xinghaiensis TaxID=1038928 RepID=A0A3R7HTQ0_9ACTN|nr:MULTISPECIES: hypothetical protein [Streptomyces]PQM19813.1 hypothetical protein Sfr7A_29850 [Streptomyces xinghaiensis]RKM90905.1 hypothetical protein SFRA_031095 [Streptomyces xinghaiensis]RNC68778.1 hypothetical protein DC095_030945 [Streptomyces xinghaiensis]
MPGNPRRVLTFAAAFTGAQALFALTATRALAEPSPGPTEDGDACEGLRGGAAEFCEREDGSGGGSTPADSLSNPLDPLSSLAKGCADAAAFVIDKLSEAVEKTTEVDFTNTEFLKQYAVVFAVSAVLTLLLWLFAVAKRAIRGVPFTEAVTEAVGFLWLTVLASAFTPLILYTVVSATDGLTEVIASGTSDDTNTFFGSFAEALKKGEDIGGGPIMLIIVSLVSVLAAGILYLELVIRAALLYAGALLGVVVYAGLVDKNMWGHVRRWAGIMIAVILVKPVIVIVLGLAGALSASEDGPNAFSAVVSGLAIILLAIFASAMIYRFVPGFGDDIVSARTNRKAATDGSQAAALISSPAALVKQGIKTHSTRGGGGGGEAAAPSRPEPRPASAVSGGVAAHSSRGGSSGGTGGGTPAAAVPRARDRATGNSSGGERT